MKFIDLTGQRFNRLTVIDRADNCKRGKPRWNCKCDCGGSTITSAYRLKNAISSSCGCLRSESMSKRQFVHGRTGKNITPEYRAWIHMIRRCENPKDSSFKNYGGRGIEVCDRWKSDYDYFLTDMGKRPSSKHSLDRINVNGNYEPSNCRWATSEIQSRNTRIQKNNSSGIRGVVWLPRKSRWIVTIHANGKKIYIGSFEDINDAGKARKQAEMQYWEVN